MHFPTVCKFLWPTDARKYCSGAPASHIFFGIGLFFSKAGYCLYNCHQTPNISPKQDNQTAILPLDREQLQSQWLLETASQLILQASVVQKVEITIHWISQKVLEVFIHWIPLSRLWTTETRCGFFTRKLNPLGSNLTDYKVDCFSLWTTVPDNSCFGHYHYDFFKWQSEHFKFVNWIDKFHSLIENNYRIKRGMKWTFLLKLCYLWLLSWAKEQGKF